MDALVMELSDRVNGLEAEIRRIRAAASHVVDKAVWTNSDELGDLEKAITKLQRELDRFAPSMSLNLSRKGGRK